MFGLAGLCAADDFDLPDDVKETEVLRIVPIEATNTSDNAHIQEPVVTEVQNEIVAPQTEKKSDGLKRRRIPENLDRPIRVGIFVGVKELYIKYRGEKIKVTASGQNIKLQSGFRSIEMESREFSANDGECIAVAPDTKHLEKSCFPGMVLFKAEKGKVTAINAVDVEDYLRGVVPYEIGKLDSSRIEALKAQAVAARTYAYKHFGSRESVGFDVYADTKDQVYKGLESATPLTDNAVKATRGIVMTYGGDFIIAYYHSTCGGKTETMATWGRGELPYLHVRPDIRSDGTPWCNESSYIKWERRFSDRGINNLLKKHALEAKAQFSTANGNQFKKIKSIQITNKLKSGRVLNLQVQTDKGHFDVVGDKTRWLFKENSNILPSSFFQINHQSNEWVIKGTGFGHGVGMCQMGVRERAKAGQSFIEILNHYYHGITLEQFTR